MRSVIALSVSLLVSVSAEHCDNLLPPTFGVVDGQLVTSSQYCPGYMPHSYVQSTVPGWYLCGPLEVHGVVPKPDCSGFIPPAYPSATPLPTYSYPSASPYPTYSDMSASPYPTYSDMSASPYPTMESSMAPSMMPSAYTSASPYPTYSDMSASPYPTYSDMSASPYPTYSDMSASPYPTYSDMSASPYPTYSDMSASPYPTMESSMAPSMMPSADTSPDTSMAPSMMPSADTSPDTSMAPSQYPTMMTTPSPSVSPMPASDPAIRSYVHYEVTGRVSGGISFCIGTDCTPQYNSTALFPPTYTAMNELAMGLQSAAPGVAWVNVWEEFPGFLTVSIEAHSSTTEIAPLSVNIGADLAGVSVSAGAGNPPFSHRTQVMSIYTTTPGTSGYYQLCFIGECTANLDYLTSSMDVQEALTDLSTIQGVTVLDESTSLSISYRIIIDAASVPEPFPQIVVYDHVQPTSVYTWTDAFYMPVDGAIDDSSSSSGETPIPTFASQGIEVVVSSTNPLAAFHFCLPYDFPATGDRECTPQLTLQSLPEYVQAAVQSLTSVSAASVTLISEGHDHKTFRIDFVDALPLFDVELTDSGFTYAVWPYVTDDVPVTPTHMEQIVEIFYDTVTAGAYQLCSEQDCTNFLSFDATNLEMELEALLDINDVSVITHVSDSSIQHQITFIDYTTTSASLPLLLVHSDITSGSVSVHDFGLVQEIQELHIINNEPEGLDGFFSLCDTAALCTPNLPYDISADSLVVELYNILGFMVAAEQSSTSAGTTYRLVFPPSVGNFQELFVETAALQGDAYVTTVFQGA